MKKKLLTVMLALSMTVTSIPIQTQAAEFSLSSSKLTVNVGDTYDLDITGSESYCM